MRQRTRLFVLQHKETNGAAELTAVMVAALIAALAASLKAVCAGLDRKKREGLRQLCSAIIYSLLSGFLAHFSRSRLLSAVEQLLDVQPDEQLHAHREIGKVHAQKILDLADLVVHGIPVYEHTFAGFLDAAARTQIIAQDLRQIAVVHPVILNERADAVDVVVLEDLLIID
jgi:16S rRNA C1402 (ribose-2'-O) methylase RsmI